jgi:hypothetical protein
MATGVGAGIGMGMATGAGPWGARAAAPPPLASAPETLWHVADNGRPTGPFPQATLASMAGAGTLSHQTLVWTPGQDGWKPAAETALATLFAQLPPPLPGA